MLFEMHEVSLGWPGRGLLLEHVSLAINTGEMVQIAGPSGCGKSTFLRLFNRLIDPLSGRFIVEGRDLQEWPVQQLRGRVAYLQQEPVMVEGDVRTNLMLPFSLTSSKQGHCKPPDESRLRDRLDHFRMDSVDLYEDATRLSSGQRQRLALIRLLLMKPDALLVDEPVSALDEMSRRIVMEAINDFNRRHGTVVIYVTHLDWLGGAGRHRVLRIDPAARRIEADP